MILKDFTKRAILLAAYCLIFCAATIAQSLNPIFVDIDTTQFYRIANIEHSSGGIGIGAQHNSDIIVKHIDDSQELSDDCYWRIERDKEIIRFRNKSTGEYLAYSPEKDYKTFINLKLQATPTTQTEWRIDLRNGYFTFYHQADVEYYLSIEKADRMVISSKGTPSHSAKYFYIVGEDGENLKAPATTPLSAYINNLAFDGQRAIFESRKSQFMYPLPTMYLDGGDYAPFVTFDTADGAEYKLVTAGTDSLIFSNAVSKENHTMQLLRNGIKVAEATIAFSPLPIVEISTTLPNNIEKEYRSGTIHILNQSTPDSAAIEQELPAFFRYRGATTLNYPKRSFNIKLRDKEGEDLDTTFFNIRSKDKWIMDAMSIDQIKMRNRVSFDIWNSYSKTPYDTEFNGRNGTKGQFVEVILNGAYNGIYCFTDRIDRKLLDLKKYKVETDESVTIRGLLYKSNLWDNTGITNSQLAPAWPMDSVVWNNWELQYPDDYPGEDTWEPLRNLYDICSGNELKNSPATYFYEDNLIDFHILVMALNLIDNGNKNIFLSNKNITKDNPFVFTPWDMDTSLGGYYDGRYYGGEYDQTPVASLRVHKNEPFATMWGEDINAYREKLAARWNELKRTTFSTDSIQSRLTNYATLFTKCGAWEREYARWEKEEKYGCPTVENIEREVESIIAWYKAHLMEVDKFIQENTTAIATPVATKTDSTSVYLINGAKAPTDGSGIVGIVIKDGKKYLIRK